MHKKYIKRGSKTFGPYLYTTYRKDGKIITKYMGRPSSAPINNSSFLIPITLIAVLFLLFFIYGKSSITGHAINLEKITLMKDESLKGFFDINMKEGEFLPSDSIINVEFEGKSKTLVLKDFIQLSAINLQEEHGDYYSSSAEISGNGLGYGWYGKKTDYPLISFKLQPEISAIQENQQEIRGIVSYEKEFVYDGLANLVPGTVQTSGKQLSDESSTIRKENGQTIVSTSYYEETYGFGKEFLTENERIISLDYSKLDLKAENPGTQRLLTSLSYNSNSIISESQLVDVVSITPSDMPSVDLPSISDISCINCTDCNSQMNNNTVFLLSQDVVYNDTCIIINSDNVTFDCQGHSIYINATASSKHAVQLSGARFNVTVRNCNINGTGYTGGRGINLVISGRELIFENLNITNMNYSGMYLNNISNSKVRNSIISRPIYYSGANYGIQLLITSDNTVFENNSISGYAIGFNSAGTSARRINLTGNDFLNNGSSSIDIYIITPQNFTLWANNIYGKGITATNTQNSSFCVNEIGNYFNSLSGLNTTSQTVVNGSCGTLKSAWPFPSVSKFDGLTSNFSLIDSAIINLTLENTTYGRIDWLTNRLNVDHANFDSYVLIGNNSIIVNSSYLLQSINSSANITLYKIAFANPGILVDSNLNGTYVVCSAPDCNILSYVSGNFTFNVTHFSAFKTYDQNISLPPDSNSQSTSEWRMFHRDLNHTGYYPGDGPVTNKTIWTYTTSGDVSYSPAVVDNILYIGSSDDNIYAINATTGVRIWNYTTGADIQSSPAVTNNIVYIGSVDTYFYALNTTNGSLIWNYNVGGAVRSSPAVANGLVYVGSDDDNVYALNATNGTKIWSYASSETFTGFRTSPAVANNIVYIAYTLDSSFIGTLYALNATNGSRIWNYSVTPAPNYGIDSSPAVANGIVYIGGSGDNKVHAINATNGSLIWNYNVGGLVFSSPAIANGMVYIGSYDNKLYALNATNGTKIWDYTTGGDITSSPAVANNIVYFGSQDNKIYAINATTGVRIWNYTTGAAVMASPAIANGIVYIGSSDDKLYAFGNATGGPSDTTSPQVSLISPANATVTSQATQTFSCNATDETALANITLYVWNSTGSLNYTNTTAVSGTYNQTNWTWTLPYSNNFKWNCLAYDSAGNSDWADLNWTLTYTSTNITSCQNLDQANTTYYLQNNVSSAGTCFNVMANNVTLDCNGLIVNYSASSAGYAVNSSGFNFTTIKNCNIKQTNSGLSSATAIYYQSSNSTIQNNTIITSGTDSYGVLFYSSSSDNTIANNTIMTSGTGSRGIYIRLSSSSKNDILNNNITTSGSNGYGITISDLSSYNAISNNNITTSGSNGYGILIGDSNSSSITKNNINTSMSGSHGIKLLRTLSINVSNNKINALGGGYGIILDNSNSSNILSNIIMNSGSSGYGIILTTSSINSISNNNITTSGSSGYGIFFNSNSDSNNLANNIIRTNSIDFVSQNVNSNNSIVNMIFNSSSWPTTASFSYSGDIQVDSINAIADLGSLHNVSKYLNITNSSAANVMMNISYSASDVPSEVDESTLKIYKHNGTAWVLANTTSSVNGVDTINNIVYANITSFSNFGIFGQTGVPSNVNLTCTVEASQTCSEGIPLMRMQNESGGYDNAHAQAINASLYGETNYSNTLCCKSNYNLTNENGTVFLKLSNYTNAHVQDPTLGSYGYDAFQGFLGVADGTLSVGCNVKVGGCDFGYTCLVSMASSESNNFTNAHVASCGHYSTQVCCIAGLDIPPTVLTIQPDISQITNINNVSFVCNSTDDVQLSNLTLQIWNSTDLWLSNTTSVSGIENQSIWNITMPDENYIWNCQAYDNLTQTSTGNNRTLIVDTINPSVNFTDPTETSGIYIARDNIEVNVTSDDQNFADITIYLFNSAGFVASVNSGSPNYNNFTDLNSDVYFFNATALDNAGNYNSTETRNVTIDITSPQFSSILVSPASPTDYQSGKQYHFNISWDDNLARGTGIFSFDNINYTMNNNSNAYYYSLTDLAAGTYNYYFWANDSLGNSNQTDVFSYTINKRQSQCFISSNSPVIYPNEINVSASCNNPEELFKLFRNDSEVTSENSQLIRVAAGIYNYTANVSETQNYTSAINSTIIIINKGSPVLSVNSLAGWTITYPASTTLSGSGCPVIGTGDIFCKLWKEDLEIANPLTIVYAAGNWTIKFNSTEGQNWTFSSVQNDLNISKANSLVYTYLDNSRNNSTIEAGMSIWLNGTLQTGESAVVLSINSNPINIGTSISNYTLFSNMGLFNITTSYPETQNYTVSYETFFVHVIDTTPPQVSLISPANATNTNQPTQTFSCNSTENFNLANITLYVWNSTGSLNYTNTTIISGMFNETNWTWTLPADGNYTWNCLASDNLSNKNFAVNWTLMLDTRVANISIISPLQNAELPVATTSALINITTDKTAVCRYNSTNSTFNFDEGINFTNTNSLSHQFLLNGLSNGQTINLYYKCNDTLGNINPDSTAHTFRIASPGAGPPIPPSCTDDCMPGGSKECTTYNSYKQCGNYDDDSCLEYSTASYCPARTYCSAGNCIACNDQCTNGQKECLSNTTFRECSDINSDGCFEWSSASACSGNQKCSGGVCSCQENWNCTDWTACTNNLQTRTCTDLNSCGTTVNKPSEQQACTIGQCSDGTFEKVCSINKPNYCLSGSLIGKCSQCGCPSGQNCLEDESCAYECMDNNECTRKMGIGYECKEGKCWLVKKECDTNADCSSDKYCSSGECKKLQETQRERPAAAPSAGGAGEERICNSEFECTELGECQLQYTISDLLTLKAGEIIRGKAERECIDKNNCVPPVIESIACKKEIPVKIERETYCNENYINIYNLNETLIARLKEKTGSKVDIDLGTERGLTKEVCLYCYDSQKNYDEVYTDCGGSCEQCDLFKYSEWMLGQEIELTLRVGDIVRFSFAKEQHTFTVTKIDNVIEFLIQSQEFSIALKDKERRLIDVNLDGKDDIEMFVKEIQNERAVVIARKLLVERPAPQMLSPIPTTAASIIRIILIISGIALLILMISELIVLAKSRGERKTLISPVPGKLPEFPDIRKAPEGFARLFRIRREHIPEHMEKLIKLENELSGIKMKIRETKKNKMERIENPYKERIFTLNSIKEKLKKKFERINGHLKMKLSEKESKELNNELKKTKKQIKFVNRIIRTSE